MCLFVYSASCRPSCPELLLHPRVSDFLDRQRQPISSSPTDSHSKQYLHSKTIIWLLNSTNSLCFAYNHCRKILPQNLLSASLYHYVAGIPLQSRVPSPGAYNTCTKGSRFVVLNA